MTTEFKSLPIVDLAPLKSASPSTKDLETLASQLHSVFATTGFAYLVNAPLSFNHESIFKLTERFFSLPSQTKLSLAKKAFEASNPNTYRGYFPSQAGSDNLKEGFEMGSCYEKPASSKQSNSPFVLTEANVFPPTSEFPERSEMETLYEELQSLAKTLLDLLAASLGKPADFFGRLMGDSVSTLRLLHYPSAPVTQLLSCTPHTDSGLLTLLHQDSTGGLEVQNSNGDWIPAPYVPESLVVNIGDLMSQMSGNKFVATVHRVRCVSGERYSVPFFCEPGVDALVGVEGEEVRYEEWVLAKMGTWVEFQAKDDASTLGATGINAGVEVGA